MSNTGKSQKIMRLNAEARERIAEMIYDEQLCAPLEAHVEKQCSMAFLDRDVNRYLLKLYQMYPRDDLTQTRIETMTRILVLTFHNMVEDDFVCATALLTNVDRNSST